MKWRHSRWGEHPDKPESWLLRIGPVLLAVRRSVHEVSVSLRWGNYSSGTGYWPNR